MIASTLREATRSLYGARLRTLLGLIGITIGIGSVIAMISTGEIATAEARKQFEAVGTDMLSVERAEKQPPSARRAVIGLETAFTLAEALPAVTDAGARIETPDSFHYAGKPAGSGSLQGVTASFATVNRLEIVEGRFVSDLDMGRYFAVVGANVAQAMRRLGARRIVGEVVEIDDRIYTVVGVLAPMPEHYGLPFQLAANKSVFVPVTTVMRTDPEAQIGLMVARVAPGFHYAEASRDIAAHVAEHNDGLAVEVTSAEQLIEQMESQLGLMTLLLGAVGSISLIVGGIGVMNIMLISVAERRREIGIRRALGASQGDIQWQFLIEALILTLSGGILGVVAGCGTAYGISSYFGWEFFISLTPIAVGVGVSSFIGLFFGFQPARQASRLDPIVALQGD